MGLVFYSSEHNARRPPTANYKKGSKFDSVSHSYQKKKHPRIRYRVKQRLPLKKLSTKNRNFLKRLGYNLLV
jgi:hypothetical protein